MQKIVAWGVNGYYYKAELETAQGQKPMPNSNIKLIIGLGNPDREYENTHHNAGLLFVDYLKKNLEFSVAGFPVILKSNSYMNKSGLFVKKMLEKYAVSPEEVLIAHDDSDLPLGKFKLSFDRSAAGHKGVQSVIDNLHGKKFWRLRIGIRPQLKTRKKAGEFVLEKIRKEDREILSTVFKKCIDLLNETERH